MKITSPIIGKAAELRVRSELIIRGFPTAVLDFDDGVDLLVNGKKVQVKASLKPHLYDHCWRYEFAIRATKFRNGAKGFYRKVYRRIYDVDFFIFWCIKDDLFYIIPAKEIREKVSLCIPTPADKRKYLKHTWKQSLSKYEKYKNNWDLLK